MNAYLKYAGVQDEFVQTIVKLGKPTVVSVNLLLLLMFICIQNTEYNMNIKVVLINGGAIAIEYLKTSSAAVLEAFYPGTDILIFIFYYFP